MGRWRRWTLNLVLLGLLSCWGGEPKLTPLLPNALSDPVPIRVEASPTDEARADYLEWHTRGVVYRLPIPRTPSAPVRRETLCYTLALQRGLTHAPAFFWREASVLTPLGDDWAARGVGVVFVGDLAGGYEFIQQIQYAPISVVRYPPFELNAQSFPLTPVYLRPQELPDHPAALLGVPAVALMDGAERLNEAQWRALILWMHGGGTLLASVNASASLLRRTPLAPYLPDWDAPRLARLTQPIALQGKQFPPPQQPAPATPLTPTRGEPIATVDKRVLATQIPYGYGRLVVFGGDLTHSAWRNWQGHSALWETLLLRPQLPLRTLTLTEGMDAPNAAARHTATSTRVLLLLVAVLMGYVGALYGLWRTLRARRRLVYAPYGVAALSGLTIAALSFATPVETESAPLQGKRRMMCVGATALEYGLWEYRSPSGEWELRWRGADALAVEPVAALNPIQVEFTSEGATLRSGSLIPTVIRLHTLSQKPAPLRLRPTRHGYELLNASEDLIFETIRVARYNPAPYPEDDPWQAWDWEPFYARNLAPSETKPFPFEPEQGYVVYATARGNAEKEQIEVWLFLP
ncbi:MAG: hypothetical protein NZM28_03255 [Fimbriimonadales bacterium]|nr:hypothetical protein [Fimbriimonadales bacterium]